jgi:hypothetical protein
MFNLQSLVQGLDCHLPFQGCGTGGHNLLVHLADLITIVDSQRVASVEDVHSTGVATSDTGAHADLRVSQLLDTSCDLGPRLWSDSMQLFPRDMASLMDEYK